MLHDPSDSLEKAGHALLETVRRNPIPAALVGVGVAWLLFADRNPQTDKRIRVKRLIEKEERQAVKVAERVAEHAKDAVEDAGEAIGHAAHRAAREVEHLAHEARDGAVELAEDVQRRGLRIVDEHPLAVGAVAMAVGAAIGLALPHSETEDTWLGPVKESLVRGAARAAERAIRDADGKVGDFASSGGEARSAGAPAPETAH